MPEISLPDGTVVKDRAIVQFINSIPWAIAPEALDVIIKVVTNHIDGIKVEMAAGRASPVGFAGAPDIAVIPIVGNIAKRLYGLDAISGGRTTLDVQNDIAKALNDSKISGIVLAIDSPGGTVDGTKELADFIYANRGVKPIIAYADGKMASAAYWIGAAADKIVAFDTSTVGSIGVLMRHIDYSEQQNKLGIKVTHMYSGKYKAMGNDAEPLSDESKAYIQDRLDYLYSIFVDSVAKYRNIEAKDVLKAADGKVFIGAKAKEVGLVDVIGNLQTAVELAKGGNTMGEETKIAAISEIPLEEAMAALVEQHGEDAVKALLNKEPEAAKEPELPAEIREMIEGMKSELTEAKTALNDMKAEKAEKDLNTTIATLLSDAGIEATDEMVAVMKKLGGDEQKTVVDVIGNLKTKVTELTKELCIETPGATGKGEDGKENVTNLDQALAYIQKRDNISDVDEALKAVRAEFPDLYKVN